MTTSGNQSYDWLQMSFVEAASGIEVLSVSRFFRDDPETHKRIINHALDEYRHSQIFYRLNKKYTSTLHGSKISTPHGLTKMGGLSRSPFPATEQQLDDLCCYLYLGEKRALEFNTAAKIASSDTSEILGILSQIENDEKGHASGLKKYLDKRNKFKIFPLLIKHRLSFFFSDLRKPAFLIALQENVESRLLKTIFSLLPDGLIKLRSKPISTALSIQRKYDLI